MALTPGRVAPRSAAYRLCIVFVLNAQQLVHCGIEEPRLLRTLGAVV
jgi:hypothetical protein